MNPRVVTLGVVVVILHFNGVHVKAACCEQEIKAFHNGGMQSPDFQSAVLEPNNTLCSAANAVMDCLVNCTGAGITQKHGAMPEDEVAKIIIFDFTQNYCQRENETTAAIKCYKNAETLAINDPSNKCRPLLEEAQEAESQLATDKQPDAVAEYCEKQGKAQTCMLDDKNLVKCEGIAYLYKYLLGYVESRTVMLGSDTSKDCEDYIGLLTTAQQNTPKAKKMCCDAELKSFNPNPISESAFQKSIFMPAKSDCKTVDVAFKCFHQCSRNNTEDKYAKAMSHVFAEMIELCAYKNLDYNASNKCFEDADEQTREGECLKPIHDAKNLTGQLTDNNHVGWLEQTCKALDGAVECVDAGEAKGGPRKCYEDAYPYLKNVVDSKRALIWAINISSGLTVDPKISKVCESFLRNIDKKIARPPLPMKTTTTTPASTDVVFDPTSSHPPAPRDTSTAEFVSTTTTAPKRPAVTDTKRPAVINPNRPTTAVPNQPTTTTKAPGEHLADHPTAPSTTTQSTAQSYNKALAGLVGLLGAVPLLLSACLLLL